MSNQSNSLSISEMKLFILDRVGTEYGNHRAIDLYRWDKNNTTSPQSNILGDDGAYATLSLLYFEGHTWLKFVYFLKEGLGPNKITFQIGNFPKLEITEFEQIDEYESDYYDNENRFWDFCLNANAVQNCKCVVNVGYLKSLECNIPKSKIEECRELFNVLDSEDNDYISKIYQKYISRASSNTPKKGNHTRSNSNTGSNSLNSTNARKYSESLWFMDMSLKDALIVFIPFFPCHQALQISDRFGV